MELKHLKSFVAVAEQLSFIRAANRLHLSQPALSSQIQHLEEELGTQLLFRNRRTVQLTDAGKIFLNDAYGILRSAEQAMERVRKAGRGAFGRLRIGFVSSAALEIVPDIVVSFRKKYPDVTLDLRNIRTTEQVEELTGKSIDVGFVRMPLAHDSLDVTLVHREPFFVVFPEGHPLAERKHVDLRHLRNERFVAYGRRWAPGFFDAVIHMCAQAGFSPNIVQETGEMYTAIALVGAGAGIAILPRSVVLAQSRRVVLRPLPQALGISEIGIAVAREHPSALIDSFLSLATEFRTRRLRRS